MSDTIVEYDERGNRIYIKFLKIDYEYWREVDEKNRCIYYRNSIGTDIWTEYSKYGEYDKIMHYKRGDGTEAWYKVIAHYKKIKITEEEYEKLKEQEFLRREQISRFKLM